MEREELIKICEDAVVHYSYWHNRDSYSAQKNIQSIYKGLTAGLDYTIDPETDDRTIWITFNLPIDFEKLENGKYLDISSREDYFNNLDPNHETEMFDDYGIDFHSNYTGGYLPTREVLDKCNRKDWY